MNLSDAKRLREIVQEFVQAGFSYYVYQAKSCTSLACRIRCWYLGCFCEPEKKSLPVHFRKTLERLGPTFIKLGQLLSTRPDFIPLDYCEELRKLQDNVAHIPFSEVKDVIENEFGKKTSDIFASIDSTPLAAASIAQVHKARLKTGETVAVKIQRKNVKTQIEQDIRLLQFAAETMEKHWPASKPYRPRKLVDEFSRWTSRELDFRYEAKAMTEMRENLSNDQSVVIPRVFWKQTSTRVLTMQYIAGCSINDTTCLSQQKIDKKRIATIGARTMLEQALQNGYFHGDPHPGNIFALRGNKVCFLDFGILGKLPRATRRKLLLIFKNLVEKDFDRAIDHTLDLAELNDDADIPGFRTNLYQLFSDWHGTTLGHMSISHAFFKGIASGVHYSIYFPSNFVLFAKMLVTSESVGMSLNPDFDLSKTSRTFVERIAQKEFGVFPTLQQTFQNSLEYADILQQLPRHVGKILGRLESPEQKLKISGEGFAGIRSELHKAHTVRTIGTILSALLIASALVVVFSQVPIFGLSPVQFFMYLTGIVGIITILLLFKE